MKTETDRPDKRLLDVLSVRRCQGCFRERPALRVMTKAFEGNFCAACALAFADNPEARVAPLTDE